MVICRGSWDRILEHLFLGAQQMIVVNEKEKCTFYTLTYLSSTLNTSIFSQYTSNRQTLMVCRSKTEIYSIKNFKFQTWQLKKY
jgi:hypothetical protein